MEQKIIVAENSRQQEQVFAIEEHLDHIELCSFLSSEVEHVEVPSKLHGKPITVIGLYCFFDCEGMKSVSLPEGIIKIEDQAFAMCKGLTELIIPNSVASIGAFAFRDCRNLRRVVLPKGLRRLPQGAFSFCYLKDPEIVLPDGLEIIEKGAFWSAGVFDLRIPDSVKVIGVDAFNHGPRPITSKPEEKGWYMEWPYGKTVLCSSVEGIITDIHYLQDSCRLHIVKTAEGEKTVFYPCDYIDGLVSFAHEREQKRAQNCINQTWKTEREIMEARKLRNAWKRGFVAVQRRSFNSCKEVLL